ncbi:MULTISPECIES: zinc-ribbon domain-containing protein [unclassified Methanoregula]|uniref:zinc-ribbon domain-containing protein n=1 Tax=unclassified Methanoregula TaxID=2649730 RepID=UPI0025F72BC4|nr:MULTISPECIES: zinc-ribbon domain-containing protein [unclassified Methanoregula]
MAQQCPRCSSINDDSVKFCTACGAPLVPATGQTPIAPLPAPSAMSPKKPGGIKILAAAILVIITIIAALALLHATGTVKILPSPAPEATPSATPVPALTMHLPPETTITVPPPDDTPVPVSFEPSLPATSPPPTKTITCPSDRRVCGANCTDIMNDRENCGDCGVTCFPGQMCLTGHCRNECNSGEISCFDGCHNLSTDTENCGTCGNICSFGLECNRSVCSAPVTTVIPTYAG